MFKDKVRILLDQALDERPDLFLIDFTVGADHRIKVVIDGDSGVDLDSCIAVSRAIEHQLDREQQDFSLEVTSAGATEPLALPRQYGKHVGRKLKVRTEEASFEGELESCDSDGIVLRWKAREPKPVGKGKVTVEKRKEIPFGDIQEARVKLNF